MAKSDTKKNTVQAKPKKRHRKLAALVIILIIIGIAGVLYEMYGSIPVSLISVASSGKPITASALEGVLLQKVASSQTFSANYTGTIIINNQDPGFLFSFGKYANNTFFYEADFERIFGSGFNNLVAPAGFGTIVYNGTLPSLIPTDVCINVSDDPAVLASVNNGGVPTTLSIPGFPTRNYLCGLPGSQFGNNVANLFLNETSISGLQVSSYSLRSFDSNPCYFVSGTAMADVNSTILGYAGSREEPASLNFSSCISAKYDVPFNFTVDAIGTYGGKTQLGINISNINQYPGLGNFA
jgi:hypothetical protein